MRIMDKMRVIVVTLLLLLGVGLVSSAKPRVIVLANSIDYELASEFFGFLGNNGMDIVHVSAADFEQYKQEKFIVILGGPDAYDGVGGVVQEVLTPDEQEYLRATGNRRMFTKTNVWTTGQRISVIAGSDRNQTKFAHVENRAQLNDEIQQDFEAQQAEIESEPKDLSISGGYQELLELEGVTVQLKSKFTPVYIDPHFGEVSSVELFYLHYYGPDRQKYFDLIDNYAPSDKFYTKMEIYIHNTLDEPMDFVLILQDNTSDYYTPYVKNRYVLGLGSSSETTKTVYFHPVTSGEKRDFTLTFVLYGKDSEDKRTYEIKW